MITQGNKSGETRRQGQPRAGQNGDHAGAQMKGGKVAGAAKNRPERRSCRTRRQGQPRAGQNGNHAGRQMKRQGGRGSQEQTKIEIMQGDK